jgi:2-polyprenyl-3-methyl-5-hydroxy-6-metoxy-1,4-benzoquinol methylase
LPAMNEYYEDTRLRFPELTQAISEHGLIGGKLLDVGCGYGHVGASLLELGYDEVLGIEPNRGAADAAGSLLTTVIHGCFPQDLNAEAESFDAVVFADSLEHMVDPWLALRETHRLLKKGGQVILSVPNVSHYSVVWGLLRGRWDYRCQGLLAIGHLRFFTPSSLMIMLREAGFDLVAKRPVIVQPGPKYAPIKWPLKLLCPHLFVFQVIVVAARAAQ